MTFRDWQELSPAEASRELRRRARTLLSPDQQRAAIAHLPTEEALSAAFSAADRKAALGGVPYMIKDLYDIAGLPTFAGSTFLPEIRATPNQDANIVRVLKSHGAVFGGKSQLHEFAYGITGENPHYGDCEHPHFPERTSGGSSSGSAATVAAGIVPLAIGSDTGGSIRVPAAFCGIYGFRLTPADDFIGDAFPLARSFDTAGWFTRNARDMATTLTALVGSATGSQPPRGCYLAFPNVDADVAAACETAAMKLSAVPDSVTRSTLLTGFHRSSEIYNHIVAAEAWQVHAPWADRFRDRYDPAVWQRLQRRVTQSNEEYREALNELARVRVIWTEFFETFDFLVMPATPSGALTNAECTLRNRNRILALTAPASLGGLPVLTIPVPLPSGLTSGLQIIVRDSSSAALPWTLARQVP